eukprot:CAMPEP_0115105974 /NCGR_PEP_ID=MMETSP0227-20121206/36350_1 /TAXON_ID=89957 /ORGANISM="Polarella glacialis, Strain CCMP 1383" /LENGTH=885 /DNA_ID=CAMNT_0002503425 /DNA_START=127 /DNA_END=2784 /DNA_ORIENTATION=+
MEFIAGAAAAVGGKTAKETYAYNRENFLYDRTLRRRKEFNIQKFKVEQAELWRKDVRDLISLTEYKMHIYLLVNVLLLSFSVILWCQGKLPPTTPTWLMMGSVLSIVGSFMFILLSIWMAMHAAVAAQGFETRLLTQMVRLPIPSWQEIEACRTYASEFERLEPSQMFRVPFAMGKQDGLVPVVEHEDGDEVATELQSRSHNDEWSESSPRTVGGTSSPSSKISHEHVDPWGLEGSGADISELGCKRGSAMIRMRHVKLARQAMVFWQSYDAFSRICMSIGVNQLLLAMIYFILGYYLAEVCVRSAAAYGVILLTAMMETLNRLDLSLGWWQLRLISLLVCVGPFMATLAGFFYLEGEDHAYEAEALVVISFLSQALYLTTVTSLCHVRMEHNGTRLPAVFRSVLYLDVFGWTKSATIDGQDEPSNASPSDYEATDSYSYCKSESDETVEAQAWQSGPRRRPAVQTVTYNKHGQPLPRRPENGASPIVNDFGDLKGAPDPQRPRVQGKYAEFFEASSWVSPKDPEASFSDDVIITGHEHEAPLILPWKIFSLSMNLLCLAWLAAAVFHALDAGHLWGTTAVAHWKKEHHQDLETSLLLEPKLANMFGSYSSSFMDFLKTDIVDFDESFAKREFLTVSWPHPNVVPHGLACDSEGTRFIVSDGLTLFSAEIQQTEMAVNNSTSRSWSAKFGEVDCDPVAGENLLANSSRFQANVSDAWLEELRVARSSGAGAFSAAELQPHARIEKAVTLASDDGCSGTGNIWSGCVLIGTSRGRVVRLASRVGKNGALAPAMALRDRRRALDEETGQHFGVLAHDGMSLQILDKAGGKSAGSLTLSGRKAAGFCAGGGQIHFLEHGPSPKIWRMPIPVSLSSAANMLKELLPVPL